MARRHVHAGQEVSSRPSPRLRRRLAHTLPNQVLVQVFGRRDSRATQRALRFFSERRVSVAFVDLARKPMAVGELRRFGQKFGAAALLDREGARYRASGLAYLSMDEDETFDRLLNDQRLLNLPLTRGGAKLAIGIDEEAWRGIVAAIVKA